MTTDHTNNEPLALQPIAYVRSVYQEKFGTPRQAGLAPSARCTLHFHPPYHQQAFFRGLDAFSHLWVIFQFHQATASPVRATVRPPRLGGNTRLGVFATRSPFRPNAIGLSCLRIERIEHQAQETCIHLSGADLVEGTPVLDIKPYIPYADSIPSAVAGFAQQAPDTEQLEVAFSPAAEQQLAALEPEHQQALRSLVKETLGLDPRPAYQGEPGDASRTYGVLLSGFNVRWKMEQDTALVTAIEAKRQN